MFDRNQFHLTIEQNESLCWQICRMNSAGKLKFFCKLLFSVFYARKNSTEMCVSDFWTVVFVLFRYKSSRVKLEEYEISSRTQLTFEERESERKLDKEKEEEIRGVYMKHYKEQKFACVCCFCWTLSVVRPCSATIKKCTLILSVL